MFDASSEVLDVVRLAQQYANSAVQRAKKLVSVQRPHERVVERRGYRGRQFIESVAVAGSNAAAKAGKGERVVTQRADAELGLPPSLAVDAGARGAAIDDAPPKEFASRRKRRI